MYQYYETQVRISRVQKNMLDIQYLGAAHGLTGILQILLSVPGYFQVYISKYFHVLLVLLKVYSAFVEFSDDLINESGRDALTYTSWILVDISC